MFTLPGYLSIPHALQKIRVWQVQSDPRFNDPGYREADEALATLRNFLSDDRTAKVLAPDGVEYEVGPDFLTNFTRHGGQHLYIDLKTGLTRKLSGWELLQHAGFSLLYLSIYTRWLSRFIFTFFIWWSLVAGALLFVALCYAVFVPDFFSRDLQETSSSGLGTLFLSTLSMTSICFSVGTLLILAWFPDEHVGYRMPVRTGCSVVVKAEELETFLSPTDTEAATPLATSRARERQAAERILEINPARPELTRAEIQSILGNEISGRAFGRAWDAARENRPEIGKPGRKSIG